jgi:hypothetical protein
MDGRAERGLMTANTPRKNEAAAPTKCDGFVSFTRNNRIQRYEYHERRTDFKSA